MENETEAAGVTEGEGSPDQRIGFFCTFEGFAGYPRWDHNFDNLHILSALNKHLGLQGIA